MCESDGLSVDVQSARCCSPRPHSLAWGPRSRPEACCIRLAPRFIALVETIASNGTSRADGVICEGGAALTPGSVVAPPFICTDVASVRPVAAAASIHVPVLLIHGADDVETRPAHSTRILSALAGPKQLLIIAGTGHSQSLSRAEAWSAIERWLALVVPGS